MTRERLQEIGLTKDGAEKWRSVYSAEYASNPKNGTAEARELLMQRYIELLDEQGGMEKSSYYPDHIKFRLLVDIDHDGPFILVTEWSGREISIDPGAWVDVECDNGDGTPAEIYVGPRGEISVHGRTVVVTDPSGNELLY